jgi:hypothetical protein
MSFLTTDAVFDFLHSIWEPTPQMRQDLSQYIENHEVRFGFTSYGQNLYVETNGLARCLRPVFKFYSIERIQFSLATNYGFDLTSMVNAVFILGS